MNLIKTSLYSTASTAIRISTSFIINKLIALYIGPAGLALMGSFQNVTNIFIGLSTGSINAGVVKYSAEYSEDQHKLKQLISTSFRIVLICSGLVSFATIMFSSVLALRILHNTGDAYIFRLFGIGIFFTSINSLISSLLNGKKEIKRFISLNISASIISLTITGTLIYTNKLPGALIAMILTQGLLFLASIYFLRKCSWFSYSLFKGGSQAGVTRQLLKFSVMGITSAIAGPLALLLIRNYIIRESSSNMAGYWEAVNRLSSLYMIAITTSLSIYYLPKLSETENRLQLRTEIFHGLKIMMPAMFITSLVIYLFRFMIIKMLFSNQFGPMEPFFLFQLIGDNIKIASWLLAYLMLAKAMAKMYIITEIVFSCTYYVFSILCINKFGAVGVTYAYAINYSLYLACCFLLLRKRFFI